MALVIGKDYNGNKVAFQVDTQPVGYDAAAIGDYGATQTSKSAGLTAVTSIANQQTATTGGVTLANQTLVPKACWRIKAYGQYTAASSATARNMEVTPYWGTTALTKIAVAVLASTAQTTNWVCEFELTASSATAIWTTGWLHNQLSDVFGTSPNTVAADLALATAASTSSLATELQAIDLRFDTSASVSGDIVKVNMVTIERLV